MQQINQQQKPKRNQSNYYLKNKERIRAQQKQYRLQNKEKCALLTKLWAKANPESIKKNRKNRLVKNPNQVRAEKAAYKRRLKNQMPTWVNKQEILNIYLKAQEQGLTVDHIIPLKGKIVSGLHVPWNLCLLSKAENSSKNNKFLGD